MSLDLYIFFEFSCQESHNVSTPNSPWAVPSLRLNARSELLATHIRLGAKVIREYGSGSRWVVWPSLPKQKDCPPGVSRRCIFLKNAHEMQGQAPCIRPISLEFFNAGVMLSNINVSVSKRKFQWRTSEDISSSHCLRDLLQQTKEPCRTIATIHSSDIAQCGRQDNPSFDHVC